MMMMMKIVNRVSDQILVAVKVRVILVKRDVR